jgi:hypothetical protein
LIEFERGKTCGNSESSLQTSDNSLIMAENCVLGALIVTSTIPLERDILASLRTLEVSGVLSLDRVSENLFIATTSVLMVASFPLSCLTWGWMSCAREWKFMSLIFKHW